MNLNKSGLSIILFSPLFFYVNSAFAEDTTQCQKIFSNNNFRKPAILRSIEQVKQNTPELMEQIKSELNPQTGQGFTIIDTSPWFLIKNWQRFQNGYFSYIDSVEPPHLRSFARDALGFSQIAYTLKDNQFYRYESADKLNSILTPPSIVNKISEDYVRWLDHLLQLTMPNEHKDFESITVLLSAENQTPKNSWTTPFKRKLNIFKGRFHVDPTFYTIVTAFSTAGTWVELSDKTIIEVPIGHTLILSGIIRGVYYGEKPNLDQKMMTWHAIPRSTDPRMILLARVYVQRSSLPESFRSTNFVNETAKSAKRDWLPPRPLKRISDSNKK